MIDFDKAMKKLLAIDGYLGSSVLNYLGETLYIDNDHIGIDIAYSASIFNDAFRMISEASIEVGLSATSFVEVKTHDGHIFLINSVGDFIEDDFSKLNVFAIFRDNGNIGLAKMMMTKVSQGISQKLERM